MKSRLLSKMIDRGVEKIKNNGYPLVNKDNIITDCVYGDMFRAILLDSLGKGFDEEINELLSLIKTHDDLMF